MDVVRLVKKYSFEEYIQLEQETDTKYEYHNGEVFAMAGGTTNHSVICVNLIIDVGVELERKRVSCRPFGSDTKLDIPIKNKYLYPDLTILCKEGNVGKSAIQNPTTIIEVLSESTAAYDRGDKFKFYRSIPSLQEYILIEQDKPQVDIFTRKGDFWLFHSIEGLEETLLLTSIDVEIPLSRIYRNVTFEETV